MANREIPTSVHSQVNPWSVFETRSTVAKLAIHTLCRLSGTIYTEVNAITLQDTSPWLQLWIHILSNFKLMG